MCQSYFGFKTGFDTCVIDRFGFKMVPDPRFAS